MIVLILLTIAFYLLTNLVLLGLGIGIGFLLNMILGISLGTASIIGIISVIFSTSLLVKVLDLFIQQMREPAMPLDKVDKVDEIDEIDETDEIDDEDLEEEFNEDVLPIILRAVETRRRFVRSVPPPPPPSSQPKPKRGRQKKPSSPNDNT
jgi:hypothetical protein